MQSDYALGGDSGAALAGLGGRPESAEVGNRTKGPQHANNSYSCDRQGLNHRGKREGKLSDTQATADTRRYSRVPMKGLSWASPSVFYLLFPYSVWWAYTGIYAPRNQLFLKFSKTVYKNRFV